MLFQLLLNFLLLLLKKKKVWREKVYYLYNQIWPFYPMNNQEVRVLYLMPQYTPVPQSLSALSILCGYLDTVKLSNCLLSKQNKNSTFFLYRGAGRGEERRRKNHEIRIHC